MYGINGNADIINGYGRRDCFFCLSPCLVVANSDLSCSSSPRSYSVSQIYIIHKRILYLERWAQRFSFFSLQWYWRKSSPPPLRFSVLLSRFSFFIRLTLVILLGIRVFPLPLNFPASFSKMLFSSSLSNFRVFHCHYWNCKEIGLVHQKSIYL